MNLELAITLLGVVGTPVVGLFLYYYRNTIVYSIQKTSQSFAISNDKPVNDNSKIQYDLNIWKLKLKNKGFRHLRDIKIHVSTATKLFDYRVVKAEHLSLASISVTADPKYWEISIPKFTMNQEIEIDFSFFGMSISPDISPADSNSNYKIQRESFYDSRRGCLFNLVAVPAYIFVIYVSFRYVFST